MNHQNLEVLRESSASAIEQYYNLVSSTVPQKEEDLQKQDTEPFESNNYELVKHLFYDVSTENYDNFTSDQLITILKRLNKLAEDIPSYITFSNYSSEKREEMLQFLIKINEIMGNLEKKTWSNQKVFPSRRD